MNQTVIDIQGITKTYVNGKLSVPVLHGIDLVVNKGEFVSIMGPSGSGKSTFMNILGCLDRPTTGSYRLNGDEVATLSDDELAYVRNKQIGFVFQSFNLLTKLTALENVALPMIYAGVNKKMRIERATQLLQSVGLGERMDHLPSELSGGQRQALTLVMAALVKPKLLLLDEPSMGLAPIFIQEIFDIIQDIQKQGTTVLLIEQNANKALAIADRGYVLETGKIVLSGTGKELASSEEVRKAYLGG